MIATATFTTGDATTGSTCSDYYNDDTYYIVCEPVVYEPAPVIEFVEYFEPETSAPKYTQVKNLLQTQNIKTNVRTRINNGRMK